MRLSIVLLSFFLFTFTNGYAQSAELENRNGFKDIKLGSPVDSVKGVKFKKDIKEKNGALAKLYTVEHSDYATIGEIKVNKIEVKSYKDLIYEITVITEKDSRLMKAMESALGKADYNVRTGYYSWVAESLSLTFQSHSRNELMLVYTSYPVRRMMKEDKEKKVEDISNDF